MIFSYFKHYFIFFNVNKLLAVPFVELARGGSRVGHLFVLYTQDYLSEHSYSSLILLIYKSSLLLAFCYLFVCMVDQSHTYHFSISPLRLFQVSHVILLVWFPLFIGGWDFWKIIEGEDQDFLVKMGGSPYRGFVYWKRGKHCLSLAMYGFWSSNGFYLASLSFRMFIIISD